MSAKNTDAARAAAVNAATTAGLRALCVPIIEAGLSTTDLLIALEGVVVGVFLVNVKLGGDEPVFDVFANGVRERLAEQRLGPLAEAGRA